jgi:ElaB/YqjD/DUF883 family membrane-anchored ribosome-binding protein
VSKPSPDAADGTAADAAGPADPDVIKADIEATRDQLAATVDELAYRLDVPARAKEGVQEGIARAKDTAVETYRESPPLTVAGALALVGVVVGFVIWRRRRSNSRRTR